MAEQELDGPKVAAVEALAPLECDGPSPLSTGQWYSARTKLSSALGSGTLFSWIVRPFESLLRVVQVINGTKRCHNSVRHEKIYICTRGACQPDVRKLFDSVHSEKRTAHSAKPHHFYEVIETLYPKGRRLELFHGGAPRAGWHCWGLEAPPLSEAAE